MNSRLVPARESDRAWLEELRRAVYQGLFQQTFGGWDEARHLRHCESCWRQGGISVIEVDNARVGMIQLLERPDVVEISEIQVQPADQGRRIGSHLLKDVIARASLSGKTVTLSVGLKNDRAYRLYERLGFHCIGRNDTHYQMSHTTAER